MRPTIFALLALVAGCACWSKSSPQYNTAQCVVARDSVDCTVSAIETLAPVALGILDQLFGQAASIDWAALLDKPLEQAGIRDGSCLLAKIEDWIAKKVGAEEKRVGAEEGRGRLSLMRSHYEGFKAYRAAWLAKHGLAGARSYHFVAGDLK